MRVRTIPAPLLLKIHSYEGSVVAEEEGKEPLHIHLDGDDIRLTKACAEREPTLAELGLGTEDLEEYIDRDDVSLYPLYD